MYAKRIVALVAALFIATGLLVGVTPQSAQAASISIANVAKTNAKDIKSKGIIRTPVVETPGDSAVVSRTYTIYKGKKVVARTTSQNKAYSLARGTYTVKSSAKYRNYTDTDQYKTHTEKYISGYTERQVEHKELINAEYDVEVPVTVYDAGVCRVTKLNPPAPGIDKGTWSIMVTCDGGAKGSFTKSMPATVIPTSRIEIATSTYMEEWFGVGQTFRPASYAYDASYMFMPDLNSQQIRLTATRMKHVEAKYNEWTETVSEPVWDSYTWDEWTGTKRTYGGTKTVTRTQKVTIGNSGYMTYYEYKRVKDKMKTAKVKSLVGGSGTVVDRYSYGKHEYVTRDFNGHYVYFDNGKVYAKYW